MRTRFWLICGLAGLTVLGAVSAGAPWRFGTERAARFVEGELQRRYGLAFSARGETTLTLLPAPRLKFREVVLRNGAGTPLVESETLSIQLGMGGLLLGSADPTDLVLQGGRIASPLAADRPWAGPLATVASALDRDPSEPPHPRRLTVRRSTIVEGSRTIAEIADATLSWPRWSDVLVVGGTFAWAGEPVTFRLAQLRPVDLLAGRPSPLAAHLAWSGGSIATDGTLVLAGGPVWRGNGRLETRSLRESLDLARLPLALGALVEDLTLEGRFEATPDRIVLPALRVGLGTDSLDGAGSVSLAGPRLAFGGTLAAERIDVTRFVQPLARLLEPHRPWGTDPLRLEAMTASDLDLRLSAARAAWGPLRFDDVAASVFVKDGQIEASIGRAGLHGGIVKGRLALTGNWAGTEIKAQAAADRVDVGALLVELGQYRWVAGTAQGQLALEAGGMTPRDLAAAVRGRAALSVEGGELAGISLEDVMRRHGAGRGTDRPAGRTPFERAQLSLTFADGIGEIGEGRLSASALSGALRGRISVPARTVRAQAEIETRAPAGGRSAAFFDIEGPWADPTVRPNRLPEPSIPLPPQLPSAASAYAR